MSISKEYRTLTRAEMDVMNILWDNGSGMTTHEIIARYREPRPVYSTVATFLKILTNKGFVGFHKQDGCGKTHVYYPLVQRAEYTRQAMKNVKDSFFGGSLKSLISFFVREEDMTDDEIAELLALIDRKGE